MPVSMFLMEIVAWGTTPPDGSVTVPDSVAPDTCAYTRPFAKRLMATITNTQTAALDFPANILDSIGILSDSLGPVQLGPVQLGPVQRRISTQLRKGPKIYLGTYLGSSRSG